MQSDTRRHTDTDTQTHTHRHTDTHTDTHTHTHTPVVLNAEIEDLGLAGVVVLKELDHVVHVVAEQPFLRTRSCGSGGGEGSEGEGEGKRESEAGQRERGRGRDGKRRGEESARTVPWLGMPMAMIDSVMYDKSYRLILR